MGYKEELNSEIAEANHQVKNIISNIEQKFGLLFDGIHAEREEPLDPNEGKSVSTTNVSLEFVAK